jgi:hypothetical protein
MNTVAVITYAFFLLCGCVGFVLAQAFENGILVF